jgi:hypothetical protein
VLPLPVPNAANATNTTFKDELEKRLKGEKVFAPSPHQELPAKCEKSAATPSQPIPELSPEPTHFLPSPTKPPSTELPFPRPSSLPSIRSPDAIDKAATQPLPSELPIPDLPEQPSLIPPQTTPESNTIRHSNEATNNVDDAIGANDSTGGGLSMSDFVIIPDGVGEGKILASSRGEGWEEEEVDRPPPPSRFVALPAKDKEMLLRRVCSRFVYFYFYFFFLDLMN